MLSVGVYTFTCTGNTLTTVNGKTAVRLFLDDTDGDSCDALIFVTEKSAGMARASLKACGFSCATESLNVLLDNGQRLAGAKVPVLIEDYNGKLRVQIQVDAAPSRKTIAALDAVLQSAKKSDAVAPSHFAGAPVETAADVPPFPSDDDIPF